MTSLILLAQFKKDVQDAIAVIESGRAAMGMKMLHDALNKVVLMEGNQI